MPIKPENRAKYPKNWKEISYRIRFERADGWCEFCQEAEHGHPHPVTGGMVVLTTAHLNPGDEEGDKDKNLAAMCQRCHNIYDIPYRRGRLVDGLLLPPEQKEMIL